MNKYKSSYSNLVRLSMEYTFNNGSIDMDRFTNFIENSIETYIDNNPDWNWEYVGESHSNIVGEDDITYHAIVVLRYHSKDGSDINGNQS